MNKLILASLFTLFFCQTLQASKVYTTVKSSDITGIKIFTKLHQTSAIHNYAVIYTNKIAGCPRGVFLNVLDHAAIYSSLLAAKIANHDKIELVAENTLFSPWGDEDFCGITSFQLIY